MSAVLYDRLDEFLGKLETTQQELAVLFDRKRTALTQARAEELLQIARNEADLAGRMRETLQERQQILTDAGRKHAPAGSLTELATTLTEGQQARLQPRIEHARQTSHDLRREGWIHWIVSHRTYQHYTELLNLIANCGTKPATYNREGQHESNEGVILDTSI